MVLYQIRRHGGRYVCFLRVIFLGNGRALKMVSLVSRHGI